MGPKHRTTDTNSKRPHLLVHVPAGLGNRLSALFSCLVAAENENLRLTIIWDSTPQDPSAPFTKLFSNISGFEILDTLPATAPSTLPRLTEITSSWAQALSVEQPHYYHALTLVKYDGLPDWEFFKRFRAHLNRMEIHPEVRALMDCPQTPSVGLHVRFSDHLPCFMSTPRWCYRWVTQAILQNTKAHLWICGDTPEFMRELQNFAPERIKLAPSVRGPKPQGRESVHDVQLALAELLTLAENDVIVGSSNSSFCRVAAFISGKPFETISAFSALKRAMAQRWMWRIHDTCIKPQASFNLKTADEF